MLGEMDIDSEGHTCAVDTLPSRIAQDAQGRGLIQDLIVLSLGISFDALRIGPGGNGRCDRSELQLQRCRIGRIFGKKLGLSPGFMRAAKADLFETDVARR
jgi:hypothetical protein